MHAHSFSGFLSTGPTSNRASPMESHALMNTNPCVRRGTLGNTHAIHSRPHTACTLGGGPAKSEPGACVVMLPGCRAGIHSKRGTRREARVAYMHTACTIGGVMQPGAGTTVERQVAGEFGDRSPVLNQTKPKKACTST